MAFVGAASTMMRHSRRIRHPAATASAIPSVDECDSHPTIVANTNIAIPDPASLSDARHRCSAMRARALGMK
jgi:hypothetical protein